MRKGYEVIAGVRVSTTLVTLSAVTLAVGCAPSAPRPSDVSLTILTAESDGVFYPLGRTLADTYSRNIPGVRVVAKPTSGSVVNLRALHHHEADIAFAFGDVAYFLYKRGTPDDPRPYKSLRAIAVLYEGAMHIVASRASAIRRVRDLRGRHVGIGGAGSGTELAARLILDEHHLDGAVAVERMSLRQVIADVDGRVEAGFLMASFPVPSMTSDRAASVRLLSLEPEVVAKIRLDYPFFRPTTIPANTYANQPDDVHTVGVDKILVCREDLPEELVYQLTRWFYAALPALSKVHPAVGSINMSRGSASPIPLHSGAARYYRERELL